MNALRKLFSQTLWFKVTYIAIAIISLVPFVGELIADAYRFTLVIGYILIAYDLIAKRRIFHNKYSPLLLGFLALLMISLVANYDKSIMGNLKVLAYMAMPLILFTTIDLDKPKESANKELKVISFVIVLMLLIIAALSLGSFIFSINGNYVSYAGTPYEKSISYGMHYGNRLAGIVVNPNALGMIATVSIMMTLTIFKLFMPRIRVRVLLYTSIVINALCLILTSSRGALISLLLFLGIYIFCILREKIKTNGHLVLKYSAIIFLCLAICIGAYASFNPLKKGIGYAHAYMSLLLMERNGISSDKTVDTGNSVDDVIYKDIGRDVSTEKEGANGRFPIWRSGARVILNYPLFGVGMVEKMDYVYSFNYEKDMQINQPHLHNIFMETAVAYGLLALIALLALLILPAWGSFIAIIKKKQPYREIVCIFAMFVAIVVSNLVEARMLYDRGFLECNFALVLGYLMYYLQVEGVYRPNFIEKTLKKLIKI